MFPDRRQPRKSGSMPTEADPIVARRRLRLAGDILWLGSTAGVCVAILGIVCWSLPAELSSVAAAGRPTATVTPGTSEGSATVPPSSTFGIDRALSSGPSPTRVDASSSGPPVTSITAATEPARVQSPLQGPPANRPQTSAPANRDGLAATLSPPRATQSAAAPPAAHPYRPTRPRQHHQQVQPSAARTNGELVPR